MYLKQINIHLFFLFFSMKHLWHITHTKPCKYTSKRDGRAKTVCSLVLQMDGWWEAMAACTAKRLKRDRTHRETVSHKITAELNQLVRQQWPQRQAFIFLNTSQYYSEISYILCVYSARGLFGVICWLACSSSWSAERKDLTLSERRENITAQVKMTKLSRKKYVCLESLKPFSDIKYSTSLLHLSVKVMAFCHLHRGDFYVEVPYSFIQTRQNIYTTMLWIIEVCSQR